MATLLLNSPGVHAQSNSAPSKDEREGSSAALVTNPASLTSAESVNEKTARENYERGVSALRDGQHLTALEWFEASHKLVANPRCLLMMASIEGEIGYHTRALKLLNQSLEAPSSLDASARSDVQELRTIVEKRLGHLRVHISVPTAVIFVDGRPLERESGPVARDRTKKSRWLAGTSQNRQNGTRGDNFDDILVDPGMHRIEIMAEGYYPETYERAVARGETIALDIKLRRVLWQQLGSGFLITGMAGLLAAQVTYIYAAREKAAAIPNCNDAWFCNRYGMQHYENAQIAARSTTYIASGAVVLAAMGLTLRVVSIGVALQNSKTNFAINVAPKIGIGPHENTVVLSGSF